jgi:hypothetical protein
MKNAMLSKVFKLSALSTSLALALAAAPAQASHVGGGPAADAGPTFITGETCVLNRLGAGDCIISGTVGTTQLVASPGESPQSIAEFGFEDLPTDTFNSVVSGTVLSSPVVSYVSDATLTAASISGTPDVSVIGFGCNNTATASGALNPCFVDVAVRAGGVVAGVVQGELSYTYSALSNTPSSTFVQTGVIHPLIESSDNTVGVTPTPPNPGQFLVNNGLVAANTDEWDYYLNATEVVGIDQETDAILSSVTVDPPVSSYLNVDVGGTYDSPTVILGEDGQRIGDASVLGSNSPESFGLSSPGSGVPEPTTLGLLGLGALAAAYRRKRRGVVGI